MESRAQIFLVVLIASLCQENVGQFAQALYRRDFNKALMNFFEMVYTISEPYGLGRKSIYFLSTYVSQYPQAIEACKALKGHLAEMNSALEFTFVSNFLRSYTQLTDEVFISGYRTTNDGDFISSTNMNMVSQVNAIGEGRANIRTYTNDSLYVFFHPNRPRVQEHMPTCLSFERRGSRQAMNNGRCADPNYRRYLCEALF